jgi:hypothetical protein
MHSSPCCSRHSRGRLSEKTKDSCGTVPAVPQEVIGWNGLEGKDGPELLAPIMSLVGEHASEFQGVRLVGVRHDVAGFIDERDPGIHFVGQGNTARGGLNGLPAALIAGPSESGVTSMAPRGRNFTVLFFEPAGLKCLTAIRAGFRRNP